MMPPGGSLRTVIAVPARYASTRLPGKPLLDIGGEPMILRVWKRCRLVRGVERIIVATDDERIRDALEKEGAEVRMTSPGHVSGTDRVAEAVRGVECDVVVNVQGDEPFFEPEAIEDLIAYHAGAGDAPVATLASPARDPADVLDPSVVKVVLDLRGRALYFSRLPVPYRRGRPGGPGPESGGGSAGGGYLLHHGVYAFRSGFLQDFTSLPQTPAEKAEGLEQLRILEHGEQIQVVKRELGGCGVDTQEDLERARKRAGGER